mmetsp:Transcript_4183/g.17751  ORF Transcript_4183/g.17751 Transcript_4183/m.17751 type:complete len:172 (-) Transcript_4183:320-835(-)
MLFSRTRTAFSPKLAKILTPSPTASIEGALMLIACSFSPFQNSDRTSVSNESTCDPYAFLVTLTSIVPSRGNASYPVTSFAIRMHPAQVPKQAKPRVCGVRCKKMSRSEKAGKLNFSLCDEFLTVRYHSFQSRQDVPIPQQFPDGCAFPTGNNHAVNPHQVLRIDNQLNSA